MLLLIFLTPVNPGENIARFDKLFHCSIYLLLGAYWTLRGFRTMPLMLFLLGFGFLIEILQHFLPPRTFSWSDILANMTGSFVGIMLVRLYYGKYAGTAEEEV